MMTPWTFAPYVLILLLQTSFCSHETAYLDIEECNIDRCRLPYCYCSNQTIPGELGVRKTPQFISITINGPTDAKTYTLLDDLFFSRQYRNPDGCPISGTLFLKSHIETDYCLLQNLIKYDNVELSITSNSSECPTVDCRVKEKGDKSPFVSWRSYRFYNETIDYRRTIQNLTGLRSSSMIGYRSPNYEINLKHLHWQILRENQFLYDSTLITREWDLPYNGRQQPSPLTWPHTMDFAPTYDCSQGCYTRSFPGLWTIPIHMYQDMDGRNCTTIGSDHCRIPRNSDGFFRYLKHNLNRHLYSNHAPFIMAFDSSWLNEPYTLWRREGLRQFIEYTLRHHSQDVYFVRLIDILNWIQQPIELDRMKFGYLSDLAMRSNCNQTITDENLCGASALETIRTGSRKNKTMSKIFDIAPEPLFRSNIVYYSTIGFFLFLLITFIYDRLSPL